MLNLYYMKRAFKYLLLIVIFISCKILDNYTSVGCTTDSKIKNKESSFINYQLNKKHKNLKQGLFKNGVL